MLLLDKSTALLKFQPSLIAKTGSSHFAFAGDFTLEIFKMKFASTSTQFLLANYNASSPFSNQRSWALQYTSGSGLQFSGSTNGSTLTTITYSWTPTLGAEYDLAVDRSGSAVRVYVDGAMVASGTIAGGLHQSTETYLSIAQRRNGNSVDFPSDGQAKGLRITRAARFATNGSYTVPSLPLPAAA